MFGIVPTAVIGGRAMVWMLGTEDVYRYGGDLVDRGPAIISHWLTMFGRLENIISADNEKAIRLLKRWGFAIGDDKQIIRGVEFVPFHIERTAIQEQSLAA